MLRVELWPPHGTATRANPANGRSADRHSHDHTNNCSKIIEPQTVSTHNFVLQALVEGSAYPNTSPKQIRYVTSSYRILMFLT